MLKIDYLTELGMPPSIASDTVVYAPFTSAQANPDSLLAAFLQGIKLNPYGPGGNSFLITGTTGSAISAPGIGAVYVGAIDDQSTDAGSGSGEWINFNVPFDGAIETSCYGPDILSPGSGPGNIGNVALVGTWINANNTLLGWTYQGQLSTLADGSSSPNPNPSPFQSFQAKTAKNKLANYTYLHSVDGGYVVGNYTTLGGPIGVSFNSGPGAGSFVYDLENGSQKNAVYKNKNYQYHSLFGIWSNEDGSYSVSGGGSTKGMARSFGRLEKSSPDLVTGLPRDAAFGRGMFADMDPVTGRARRERYYNYGNTKNSDTFTHFQGIYYAGEGIYQAPFDAVLKSGEALVGIAYVKRRPDGKFSRDALWQVFPDQATGSLFSNDSVAASGSVGAFNNGTFTSFASLSDTKPYLEAAQLLT